MEIDIRQDEVSLRDKYQIFIDGQQRHHATAKLFRLLAEIDLYEWDSELPKIKISKVFDFFVAEYQIIRSNGKEHRFQTKSYWKGHYQCICDVDVYDIYAHRGCKYSIYKNDMQVAWWSKEVISFFSGDDYKIIADSNCDYNLIIAFCLIIDNYKNEGKERPINIDFGRLGLQTKKFDPHWQPK